MDLKELKEEIKRIKIDSDNFIENSNYGNVEECSKEVQRISRLEGIKQTVESIDNATTKLWVVLNPEEQELWREIRNLLTTHKEGKK